MTETPSDKPQDSNTGAPSGPQESPTALSKLPVKEQLFVLYLSADPKRNGTKAVQKVWKQTDPAAAVTSSRLLKKAKVKAALDEEITKRGDRIRKDGDYILRRMFEAEGFDITDIMDQYGHVLPVSEWPEGTGRLIESIKSTVEPQYDLFKQNKDGKPAQVERIEVTLPSRKEMWKLLGTHFGLFKKEIDVNIKGGLADRIRAARQRTRK